MLHADCRKASLLQPVLFSGKDKGPSHFISPCLLVAAMATHSGLETDKDLIPQAVFCSPIKFILPFWI